MEYAKPKKSQKIISTLDTQKANTNLKELDLRDWKASTNWPWFVKGLVFDRKIQIQSASKNLL